MTWPRRSTRFSTSSGAERDEDGSVIAARSVSRDGPSRAYLGGRSVPAKSLSAFTTELLTLHGQNDQLRLMRADEQRAALDRFADVGPLLKRYRKVRDVVAGRAARPGRQNRSGQGNWRRRPTGCKFGLGEIDAVDPQPGEDDALVDDIRRLSELDALREAAQTARSALSGALDDAADADAASAAARSRAGEVGAGSDRRHRVAGVGGAARGGAGRHR